MGASGAYPCCPCVSLGISLTARGHLGLFHSPYPSVPKLIPANPSTLPGDRDEDSHRSQETPYLGDETQGSFQKALLSAASVSIRILRSLLKASEAVTAAVPTGCLTMV